MLLKNFGGIFRIQNKLDALENQAVMEKDIWEINCFPDCLPSLSERIYTLNSFPGFQPNLAPVLMGYN